MKRDWLLIREILFDGDLSGWGPEVVRYHEALCCEAGYLRGAVLTGMREEPAGIRIVWKSGERLTLMGYYVAEILENKEDLEKTIRELDEAKVGHRFEIVFDLMAKKAVARLPKMGGDS